MNETINSYLISLLNEKNDFTLEMEQYAALHNVPIMEPLGIEFLKQLIRIQKPKRVLEIGAAIGYSAIRIAETLPDLSVVSVERDINRYEQAKKFIEQSGLENRITVIYGDALEVSEQLGEKGPYDFLFIDAAKGQYKRFFELYTKYLIDGGTIITDNVLFKGIVADEELTESTRLKKLGKKIHSYNEWLTDHPEYHTTIIPLGDGIAITVKS
ncbi:putative O-methyltransferase YrrM [Salirhabdus euzebyi]|uniref:tRNA 5-hydroxyuridine methyltransferase n=1 Tax=Salirhabdus euzebyi TaxID=394506 RepID=A0A841Q7J1_9BACI|nr:O-methyltransferase [Salirhabdus euzebyi]MBB6454366.1 putative O-methyltransferase YrrM [Salirhabdus euzebyi]